MIKMLVGCPPKRDFLEIYLTAFSKSVIPEIQNLRAPSFFSKYLKLNLDLKNTAKNWEKVFRFWGNCIVKLSLLRTEYLSSESTLLTSSPKIWHVKKRDFFWLNWLAVINEYDKSALMQIWTLPGHVYHVAFRRVL